MRQKYIQKSAEWGSRLSFYGPFSQHRVCDLLGVERESHNDKMEMCYLAERKCELHKNKWIDWPLFGKAAQSCLTQQRWLSEFTTAFPITLWCNCEIYDGPRYFLPLRGQPINLKWVVTAAIRQPKRGYLGVQMTGFRSHSRCCFWPRRVCNCHDYQKM